MQGEACKAFYNKLIGCRLDAPGDIKFGLTWRSGLFKRYKEAEILFIIFL